MARPRIGLTDKEELFCQLLVQLGNATEAYVQAFDWKGQRFSASQHGSQLKRRLDAQDRIAEIRANLASRHDHTVDSIANNLFEAYVVAQEKKDAAAMVSAMSSLAKLCGFLETKVTVSHSFRDADEAREYIASKIGEHGGIPGATLQ